MDFSRAFDNMPHALLIRKHNAYVLPEDACNLMIIILKIGGIGLR